MKIFLTGATGYLGKRLLIQLLEEGHHVVCSVRDQKRLSLKLYQNHLEKIQIIENDFLDENSLQNIPQDIDFAYYLVHLNLSISGFLFFRCFWLIPEFTLFLQRLKELLFSSVLIIAMVSASEIPN